MVAADFRRIGPNGLFRPDITRARDDIEGPAMQRAVDLAAFKPADSERSAAVRAIVIDGVESPVDVEKREPTPAHLEGSPLAGRKTGNLGDF